MCIKIRDVGGSTRFDSTRQPDPNPSAGWTSDGLRVDGLSIFISYGFTGRVYHFMRNPPVNLFTKISPVIFLILHSFVPYIDIVTIRSILLFFCHLSCFCFTSFVLRDFQPFFRFPHFIVILGIH
jgi:hypothetical protein